MMLACQFVERFRGMHLLRTVLLRMSHCVGFVQYAGTVIHEAVFSEGRRFISSSMSRYRSIPYCAANKQGVLQITIEAPASSNSLNVQLGDFPPCNWFTMMGTDKWERSSEIFSKSLIASTITPSAPASA